MNLMAIDRKYATAATLVLLMLIYSLCGFYLLPTLLRSKLPAILAEKTGQQFSLAAADFNPYQFRLVLQDFQANSPQGRPLLGFERLSVTLDVTASLRSLALVLAEISLDRPHVDAERTATGHINLADLKPGNTDKAAPAAASEPLPPLLIRRIAINDGELHWQDHLPAQPQTESLTGINLQLTDLTTLGDAEAPLHLELAIASGGRLAWQGGMQLSRLSSKGSIRIEELNLAKIRNLVALDSLPVDIVRGSLNLQSDYDLAADGVTPLRLTNGKLVLSTLEVQAANDHGPLLQIPGISVDDINIDIRQHRLDVRSLSGRDARIAVTLDSNGRLNWQTLFAPGGQVAHAAPTAAAATPQPAAAAQAWQINVDTLQLKNYRVDFADHSRTPANLQHLTAINVELHKLGNQRDLKVPLQISARLNDSGQLQAAGELSLAPAGAALDIQIGNIKLKPFQDYLNDYLALEIADGAANGQGHLSWKSGDPMQLQFQGEAGIANLITRDRAAGNKDFLKWTSLRLQQLDLQLPQQNFSLGEVLLERPYLRVTVKKDRGTNIQDILVKRAGGTPQARQTGNNRDRQPIPGATVYIGKIRIIDGHSDFTDQSLILPFMADMDDLDGEIDGYASRETQKSVNLSLRGQVYNMAQVAINGAYQPISGNSNIVLKFTHMPLPLITPYMADFAGYRIEKGQMALDLHYTVDHQQLNARNRIFIDQLTLGDKVENPHATSLPLQLAIALLKDADGKINLDFPITGSLGDPEFSIGSLISDVLVNFIDKLVTSPFKALGGLFDNDPNPGAIDFLPGQTQFSPGETAKLDALAQALRDKPGLTVDIKGIAYQILDWPQMQPAAVTEILKKMKSGELRDQGEQLRSEYIQLSSDEYRRLLAKFYKEVFPEDFETGLLGAPHSKSQSDADFYAVAEQKLAAAMQPDPQRLNDLAIARANALARYLTEKSGLNQDRIYILAPDLNTTHNQTATSRLTLNTAH